MVDPVKYVVHAEIDIEELAFNMSHEQAENAILEIDRVLCDLDFTLAIAKKLCEAVFKEGHAEYSQELAQFVAAMSTPPNKE